MCPEITILPASQGTVAPAADAANAQQGANSTFGGRKVHTLATATLPEIQSHLTELQDTASRAGFLQKLARSFRQAHSSNVQDRFSLLVDKRLETPPLAMRRAALIDNTEETWRTPLPQKIPFDAGEFDADAAVSRLQKKYPQCDEWDISGAVSDFEYKRDEIDELQYLTVDEYVAISLYSALEYSTVNSALRTKDDPRPVEKFSDWKEFVGDINAGLAKLNAVQRHRLGGLGALHRGTSVDTTSPIGPDNVKEGGSLKDPAFLSTSKDPKIAERFADEGDGEVTILEHIFGSSGGGVETLSEHEFEKEVLFPAGTEFTVLLKQYDSKRQVMKIVAEEAGTQGGSQGYADALLDASTSKRV